VTPALLRRLAALAAVALVATLGAIALGRAAGGDDGPSASAPKPVVRWEEARVAVFGRGREGQQTACGVTLAVDTRGVAHPVLPCGVVLILSHGGRRVRTEVIEQGPAEQERAFDVTAALAEDLAIERTAVIRWRFPAEDGTA
jgi:hypothetical protein